MVFFDGGEEGFGGDVLAEVDDAVAAVFKKGRDDILAEVVDVALHGAKDQCTFGSRGGFGEHFLDDLEGGLHGFGAHHDLREEDFPGAVAVTDLGHGSGEAALDDLFR